MKTFWPLVALGLLSLVGVAVVLHFGVGPKAVRLIGLSPFQNPQHVVAAMNHRVAPQLKRAVWLIGLDPQTPASLDVAVQLVEDFASKNQGQTFTLLRDPRLREYFAAEQLLKVQGYQELAPSDLAVENLWSSENRVVLLTLHAEARSAITQSFAHRLAQQKQPYFSLIFTRFPRHKDEENSVMAGLPCQQHSRDLLGTGELGCEVVSIARLNYRRKIEGEAQAPLVGLMSQIGTNDFLFLLRDSGSSKFGD